MYQKGRAWIELNMNNLAHNLEQLQAVLPQNCELMPAVKANAYGHGAIPISLALQQMGIGNFCVATVNEAVELRVAGIEGQILILGYTSPYRFEELCRYELTQTVVDYDYAKRLNEYGYTLNVHVGIDTGMHRLGIDSQNIQAILDIWTLPNIKVKGVFSHLCVSDGRSKTDKEFTMKQIECFKLVINKLHKAGIYDFKAHIQGSYGVLNYPDLCFDYARVGIALYGILSSQSDETKVKASLKPVLSLKSRIECIKILHEGESLGYGLSYTAHKETRAAVVSIGYADGIPRELSNKGRVLINGKAASMIGRICMDQLFIDVSDIPEAAAGDEVILIGRSGGQEITVGEYADSVGTITNEILSRLGNRLERTIY
ncbi:MAG: serine racemase VanT catalytic subunit [Clostridiales bacterium]|nr:serine racemase VanT catalytic subunit [Clostridiales bacterium]